MVTLICLADESDIIYDDSQILEFHITFTEPDWFNLLMDNYYIGSNQDEWIYTPATFTFDGVDYDSVGVRFKGYKSMGYPTEKKPFKIKFDEYILDQEFYGVDKINLNNEYFDPSFLREKIIYDVFNKFIPSSRANFAKLYVNGEYLGLYTNVEQVNKKFIERHYGNGEDGNLFKGDPHGDLVWYGPNQESYNELYELKTNELENDWSDLLELINIINNTPADEFVEEFEDHFHIHNFLFYQVINNYFINLDSYFGNSRNYYIYHRDDTNKFTHIPWDFNFAFGLLALNILDPDELLNLNMFWEYDYPRPLYQNAIGLNGVDDYKDVYKMVYKYLTEIELNYDSIAPHIDEFADLIREAVYADTLKMFTNEEFETNLEEDIEFGNTVIFGLKSFVETRDANIDAQLQNYIIQDYTTGIFVNEIMAKNVSGITDQFGNHSDWIELYNSNDYDVNLSGLFLSDNAQTRDKWQFPEVTISANEFLIIWANNDSLNGGLNANFNLEREGEFVGLYNKDGVTVIDSTSYPALEEDISYGRYPDGSDNLGILLSPTPNAPNETVSIEDDYPNTDKMYLLQNYPNPFKKNTIISFSLGKGVTEGIIEIFNLKGQLVKEFSINNDEPEINWDAYQQASGIYFYKMTAGKFSSTKKMLLLK